jgi:MinD-like ATPase involved in chromosome partitioning or flagellar assembly
MDSDGRGQVVTFYSYKGGTGRTMALANVAWILAANGKRVLVVDWDLESPGLHRFFKPFINPDAVTDTGGVIDLIREYEWATTNTHRDDRGERWHEQYAEAQKYAFTLDWSEFPPGGTLDFLSAGRQNNDYAANLAQLDWDNFYDKLGGGQFFDALRADMKRRYDYTLIDSRTGLSDVADICTIHLPDVLVDCFTLSEQGIEGAADVAQAVQRRYKARKIRILPIPMRIDPAEKLKADNGRAVAKQRFEGLPAELSDDARDTFWNSVYVPYQAFYSYEETLATFGDTPGAPGSLLAAYEAITAQITGNEVTTLPRMEEAVREREYARFVRQPRAAEDQVTLRYAAADQAWAEWIEQVLVSAGVRVLDPVDPDRAAESSVAGPSRQLTIVSQVNREQEANTHTGSRHPGRPPLAIYVADVRPLPHIQKAHSVSIASVPADAAIGRILRLVGRATTEAERDAAEGQLRYPGADVTVFNVPLRNPRFTGREEDLRRLRNKLRTGQSAVVLPRSMPVALQGMGGIGKTHLALEYAYRFQSAYDVVWWVDADPPDFVDVALADLGTRLGIPTRPNVKEATGVVLQALYSGEPYRRWLVIFDNAEDLERIREFLPKGSGHVLITSRNPAWTEQAEQIQVDVFQRRESVAHLLQRVPTLRAADADQVAETLGDLPIAIAAAGAWLHDTGAGVDEYLRQIEQHGPRALTGTSQENSVEATWDLSLQRLQARSPAAYRLLQLCSVLAPEIALELVYSEGLATVLAKVDRAVADRLIRATLVRNISRLALLRVDQRAEQGPSSDRGVGGERKGGQILVHRLLQHVVRSRMSEDGLAETRHEVHLALAASRPPGEIDDPDTWSAFRMLWPHLEISGAVNCPDETVRQLLIERVRYLWLVGDLARGQETATQIEQAWTRLLGEPTTDTDVTALRRQLLHLRFNRANILRDLGLFEDSRVVNEQVLSEQRELLGPDHPHTLMTAGGLAGDLRGLGRYREALDLDQETHRLWEESLGEHYPRTLVSLGNLAASYRLMGDFRGALSRDQHVYEARLEVLSENHPNTLISASNIGRDLREAGEFGESVAALRDVTRKYLDTLGPASRGAKNAEANLAVSLRSAGQAGDASELLDRAYGWLNDNFGPHNPDTLACRLSRAMNLLATDHVGRAERELREVRTAYRASLGPTHPHTLVCENNLAAVARALGDHTEARNLAQIATRELANVLGPDHPYALAALMNLAICSAEIGDQQAAHETIDDAAARIDRVLGSDHPDTLRCLANRALIRRVSDPDSADGDEIRGLELALGRRLGSDHPAVRALRDGRYLHRTIDPHPY